MKGDHDEENMTMRTDDEIDDSAPPPEYSEPAPAEDADAPGNGAHGSQSTEELPKKEVPLNILVIGETQNGKSTMIKQIGVYAGVPDIDIKIGFG